MSEYFYLSIPGGPSVRTRGSYSIMRDVSGYVCALVDVAVYPVFVGSAR